MRKPVHSLLLLGLFLWSSTGLAALKVLMVSPEQTGIFQTGGLAHATTGLAAALNQQSISTQVLMPYYLEMKAPLTEASQETFEVPLDWRDGRAFKVSKFR